MAASVAHPIDRGSVLRSAGWIVRAPGGPVHLDRDAPGVGSRVPKVEGNVRAGVGEQSGALAKDYGDNDQRHLVDQVVGEQPSDQGAAAVHLQLAGGLGFQLV